MITRNDILASLPQVITVETEAWGTCYVRQIKGNEFERFMAILDESRGGERLARLTVLGLCDAGGNRILADGDEPIIQDAPLEPQGVIAAAFLELNGVEEQKKSSEQLNISLSSSPTSLGNPTPVPLSKRFQSES